jgi:urease accessory protein
VRAGRVAASDNGLPLKAFFTIGGAAGLPARLGHTLRMTWIAALDLRYTRENGRSVARFAHDGPLRILQSLWPEGDGICHNVLVHPPSGLVGGDTLDITVRADRGTHALLTTPGASRFYRSDGPPAVQRAQLHVAAGARLDWLPQEAICYSGCIAENHLVLELDPGAELIGWDVLALGLPASELPFADGSVLQHLELRGAWLERGRIDSRDARLMDGPLGLAGQRCIGTLFMAHGTDMSRALREQALEVARDVIATHALAASAGATAPGPRVVAVRVLAPLVEPALELLKAIRDAWRVALWGLPPTQPRSWGA